MTLCAFILFLFNLDQTIDKLHFAYSSPTIIDGRMRIGTSGNISLHSLLTNVIFAYFFNYRLYVLDICLQCYQNADSFFYIGIRIIFGISCESI